MTERTNRRELIIHTAAQLFIEQGYQATSVRQIADEVGCTEAALYYHFKDGKRELMKAVVECHMPNLMSVVEACSQANSLYEMVLTYGQTMTKLGIPRMQKIRWIFAEFPNFTPEERAHLHQKQLTFHQKIKDIVLRFVDTPEHAERLAWVLMCAGFGYGQLFWNLDLHSVTNFTPEEFTESLATFLSSEP